MYVSFSSVLRHQFFNPSSPPNQHLQSWPFEEGPQGSGPLMPHLPLSQGRAPRLFRSMFWSLVTSFLSCPPGLGRLVWAAASFLVRPFRPPTPGNPARAQRERLEVAGSREDGWGCWWKELRLELGDWGCHQELWGIVPIPCVRERGQSGGAREGPGPGLTQLRICQAVEV